MTKTIALVGALDTKGQDFAFIQAEIERRGFATCVIDFGVLGDTPFAPTITRHEIARMAGTTLEALIAKSDRGEAMRTMSYGLASVLQRLTAENAIHGVMGMGGGGGTSVATHAMRTLPLGLPKVMVSTVASGDVSGFVGMSDIVMIPSIIDVNGINRISRRIYSNAIGAICGMVATDAPLVSQDKPLIAISMFGNTTRAVNHAKSLLEAHSYEVLVFHATGTGGRTMESLIRDRQFVGVLDMTTTEWADELCGGVLSAGDTRLEAAAQHAIPQVVVPGCIDMCNFWARNTVPVHYEGRLFYEWNANITLMRTTPDETAQLGRIFAQKLNQATAPVSVHIPMAGVSEIDGVGKPFYAPDALIAFRDALKADLRPDIAVIEHATHINDKAFVQATVDALLTMIPNKGLTI
jgi:uncharacterized protein (UPF0261 family)